ncbi:GDSL-type esterase/lipase family protein [Bacteroidota bacterium]
MIPAIIIGVLIITYIVFIQIFLYRDNPKLFNGAIRRYQRLDKSQPPSPGSIACTGSSVMKYWKTIEKDLSPLPVLNRAIAGIKINELTYWANELVSRYKPAAVMVYAGSNDISGRKPRSPEQVLEGFRSFVLKVREHIPAVHVFYISINPTPANIRWKHWHSIQAANNSIKSFCEVDPQLTFIDVTEEFLNEQTAPRKEYFRIDKVHLNSEGYKAWTRIIKPILDNWIQSIQ